MNQTPNPLDPSIEMPFDGSSEPKPSTDGATRNTDMRDDVNPARGEPYPIVGIGASAGGLEAISGLLHELPPDTGMAFVVVQHLDPRYDSQLSELLARTTKMPVFPVQDGER